MNFHFAKDSSDLMIGRIILLDFKGLRYIIFDYTHVCRYLVPISKQDRRYSNPKARNGSNKKKKKIKFVEKIC